jgi:hypothetical protein
MINKEHEMKAAKHFRGTLQNGVVQTFVLSKTDKLVFYGCALALNKQQATNLRKSSGDDGFALAKKYWDR